MFVEVVRLLIVVLATAAGYELSRQGGADPGSAPALGATLGALIGYVTGGVFGRLLARAMGQVEEHVARTPTAQLLAGTLGAVAAALLAGLVGVPAVALLPGRWGWPVYALVVWVGLCGGWRVASRRSADLLGLAGLRSTVSIDDGRVIVDGVLVDTSAVIDGRIAAVVEAGFLSGPLLVPRFVLDELQGIADAADESRRRRGRRGLETLTRLPVHVLDDEVPELVEVDAKLVQLARRRGVPLVTTDDNLQRVAELQGVRCLNVHRLSNGLRPALVPGEVVRLPITREGKEPGQGVGFLDDGTMVVVGDAAGMVGREVSARITTNVQTSVGRMFFANLAPGG